jgi:SAM-dependent methyltransferase
VNARLISILICPACHGRIEHNDDELQCQECKKSFLIQNEVPVFLSSPVAVASATHQSNAIGLEYESILRAGKDFVLHIGAGATEIQSSNCIEFEHKIFRHTDVVGDAHHLPFRDEVFDHVFAFNVFEHLRDPKAAAAEIYRVLKPTGSVAIHTAFLQALHEEPTHFFGATEYGVREWFSKFDIERCDVSANFSPAYMLAFLASNVLEAVSAAQISAEKETALRGTSIEEWAAFWNRRTDPPAGFDALQTLPQHLQRRIAAGFELIARKPRSTLPASQRL